MNAARLNLDTIVDPTFEDFRRTAGARQAFLACETIFHAVDYAARPKNPAPLRQRWGQESMEFSLVDSVAHHFKHVASSAETQPPSEGIPITHVLGFGPTGIDLERRIFYFVMRDAISFLLAKAADSALRQVVRERTD
jgi:hypothetical protein